MEGPAAAFCGRVTCWVVPEGEGVFGICGVANSEFGSELAVEEPSEQRGGVVGGQGVNESVDPLIGRVLWRGDPGTCSGMRFLSKSDPTVSIPGSLLAVGVSVFGRGSGMACDVTACMGAMATACVWII